MLRLLLFTLALATAQPASAHQPRIPEGTDVTVENPEVSKAYYATLEGTPHLYHFRMERPFDLYVGILVPFTGNKEQDVRDVTATVTRDGKEIARLGGKDAAWKEFFEPFGRSTYWEGPELKTRGDPGAYEIRVASDIPDTRYSLAVGEREEFDLKESINAALLVPQIKRTFFHESPAGFLLSPIGAGYAALMIIAAFVFGFLYRAVLRRFARNSVRGARRNIGTGDRLVRLGIAIVLFLVAITTTWNPLLLFLTGFALFEAIFHWCGLYAALGRTTCALPG